MSRDRMATVRRTVAVALVLGGLASVLTACSSTPSATRPKKFQVVVEGSRSNIVDLISVAVTRYSDTESSTNPNDFENAGAATRYAAFSLHNFNWPKAVQPAVENLRGALLKLSDDLEQAADPQANLATVKQVTAFDAANVGTANQALLAKLPGASH